ncbi:hypothetical protein [Tautonia plasticadhaerens]|uniref:LTXXQ motif protein n=1 Tax=Tautonia plasticadhaerens TaxID=2527974 RepID=A0A518H8I5_9BACT|nr:hypothetical protein [Tautonia plasticadhaerens]QDV37086.1 LTXXQ motif protein [Tautonia plasticadhaerens]
MNATRRMTIALGIVALLAAPAAAQRGGGQGQGRFGQGMRMGMPGGLAQLAMAPPVQEELALSDDQIAKIEPIGEQLRSDMMSRMQEMRDQLGDLAPEARRDRFEQMSRELNAAAKVRLEAVLKPEQLDRLVQIELQQQGVQAFSEPAVVETLKLTDDQKAEIDGLLETYRTEVREAFEAARGSEDRGAVMRELVELRQSSMDAAMAVLTDDQKASWEELTGEPFQMGPGFGPGGGRGGPGGGRPND